MRLILLRHAKAHTPPGTKTDHERPLAPRGIRQAEAMGQYMVGHALRPDLALVSTAERAQQTWSLAASAFEEPIPQQNERGIYDAPASRLLDIVRGTDTQVKTLLLVGHNPGFEQLAASLAGTGEAQTLMRMRREYPTAGLAVLDFEVKRWSEVAPGSGNLERFETLATLP